jgi:cell division protein FtsZ
MGGGTGTGASPVIARLAHELEILTVAVVTIPFRMEGPGRYNSALEGVKELNEWVDSLLVIDNERLRMLYGKLPLKEAFGKADDVLSMATKGIAEIITVEEALVRVDFADVKKVMLNSGRAHMSMVKATGENRALEVAEAALSSSLLDDNNINGAKEILLNFAVRDINNITHDDITVAMECIQKHASFRDEHGNVVAADIIWGACQKPSLDEDELELVVVATRFTDGKKLPIDNEYKKPTTIIDTTPEDENVDDDTKDKTPGTKKPNIDPTRKEVIITPQRDKYRQVGMQKREPAYVRMGAQFEIDSDTQQRVNYQQRATTEEPKTDAGSGMLQF